MAIAFHTLSISAVDKLTDDAVALRFDVPQDLAETFAFAPGQYLTLKAEINGKEVRRSYSICASPHEGLQVGIKQVPNGVFSSFAQSLKPGDVLEVMPAEGRFICEDKSDASRDILLIAAGSGITPILSIAKSVLEGDLESTVTLVYGNRMTSSIMFRTELEDLKDKYLERFFPYHVLSRETQDVELLNGRIDVEKIEALHNKGVINSHTSDGIYLCGPAAMTLSLAEYFAASGVDKARIHTELFDAPDETTVAKPSAAVQEAVADGVAVSVVLDGVKREFVLTAAEDTVLQAAEKSGLELPFSCAGGMCATCRCRVVDGNVSMDRNFSLDDWEVEAGFVLACQSRPTTGTVTLDFDAA